MCAREPKSRIGLFFAARSPAQAERYGWPVVLALHRIDPVSVVESEDLVAQVQSGGDHLHSPVQAEAALHVELRVGIEVVVSGGALQPDDRIARRAVRRIPLIC